MDASFRSAGSFFRSIRRRACATLGVLCFALLAFFLAAVALPLMRWATKDDRSADLQAQAAIQRAAGGFLRLTARLGLVRVRVDGGERLEGSGSRLIVANHPTLLDVVVLLSLLPQADCIVSGARAAHPVLRGVTRAAGYISHEAGPRAVAESVDRIRAGRTVLVFPEGTRSPAGGLGPFQRGAAHIALNSGVPLHPVLLTCNPPALTKEQSWYHMPEGGIDLDVRVLEPLATDALRGSGLPITIAARRLTAELREVFAKESAAEGLGLRGEPI